MRRSWPSPPSNTPSGDFIYVLGGVDSDFSDLSSVLVSLATNTWTEVAPKPTAGYSMSVWSEPDISRPRTRSTK